MSTLTFVTSQTLRRVGTFLCMSSLAILSAPRFAFAQTPAPQQSAPTPAAAPAKNDYSKLDTWICLPGRQDACTVDLSTTVIAADGKTSVQTFTPNPNAAIDCFYVYPTVSDQSTLNSDMSLDPAENGVVRSQFALFGSQCRLYAPLYRQVTLTALRELFTGGLSPEESAHAREFAYNDVLDAFHYYFDHYNKGRGFVLIAHSQGSNVLMHLIHNEIDGKPVQSRLVSAILLGVDLPVPKGKDVGGVFEHIPLCHAATQTGCVITYVSFRATPPPPPNTRFGAIPETDMIAGCTNPAALGGGSGELHAYLPSNDSGYIVHDVSDQPAWLTPAVPINTPFVSLPGMLTAECVASGRLSYLAVTIHDTPSGPRTHDIGGDLVVDGMPLPDWGLHLIDVNLALGNLVDIVGQQAKFYASNAH